MLRVPVPRSFMVVGNERRVGTTLVTCAIVQRLREAGVQAIAMKPAARADRRDGAGARSSELQQLAAASAFGLPPRVLCPFILPPEGGAPVWQGGAEAAVEAVVDTFRVLSTWGDTVVIEGADDLCSDGGLRFDSAELARELDLPVLLVVGVNSGCVASAQGRIAAFTRRGVQCVGWVANEARPGAQDPQGLLTDLAATLPVAGLGAVPSLPHCTPGLAARSINMERMLLALAG